MAIDLAHWQNRLQDHFRELSAQRRMKSPDRRIFGLEHGLDKSEIQSLTTAVRAHIAVGPPELEHSLAWIVYAAEVGYRYSGDEYWQTFEDETPGWISNGDRYWIRRCFHRFQEEFSGVVPGGAWAKQFSIICWPITHAILPTDLQRQLARILFELRHSFSAELFESPSILGKLIAERGWNATSRFQNLTQEPQLLGQIAAALLLQGEFGTDSLIFPATLRRIGEDLARERRAREWLRGARRFAKDRAQIRGIGLFDRSTESSEIGRPEYARAQIAELGIEPQLVLRPMDSSCISWEVSLEIPDLSHLLLRFPRIKDILIGTRCVVAGSSGRPLARGQCLHGAQRVTLIKWPKLDEVLLQFEQTDPQLEFLLRTECLLRPGPIWLFRITSDGLAYECRSLCVRPGGKYILISTTGPIRSSFHTNEISLTSQGAYGAILELPPAINEDWEEVLQQLGLGQSRTVEVWPAGLSAASWDGEGHGEWLASERPCLGIQSDHPLADLKITMSTDANLALELSPVKPGEPIFVELPNLPVGLHTVHVSAESTLAEETELISDLDVVIRIREARLWSPDVNPHGPLLVQMEPSVPTLEQIWEGRVEITIQGPADRNIHCSVSLFERNSSVMTVSKQLPPMRFPVTPESWRAHFERHFRKTKEAENLYDTARSCELEFDADELGRVKVQCELEFTPLRWTVRRRGKGYFVRLLDDSGADVKPEVTRVAFETPCVEEKIGFASECNVPESGGMYVARMSSNVAAVIVAPVGHGFADFGCNPRVDGAMRSSESIIRVLEISRLWGRARLTGNIISAILQRQILLALLCHIAQLLGGDNWARAESVVSNKPDELVVLRDAISKRREEIGIGENLIFECSNLAIATHKERVKRIASLAVKFHLVHPTSPANEFEPEWLSEFALRLASDPVGVVTWAGDKLRTGISRLLELPTLVRAARFLVIATHHHLNSRHAPDEIYAGWGWK